MNSPTLKNNQIRQQIRIQRRALTTEQQLVASFRLLANLNKLHVFRRSKKIACYIPNDGEISCLPAMEQILTQRQQCYLPVISGINGNMLWFAEVHYDSSMGINRYGIPEPTTPLKQLIHAKDLDLLLVPLVAFNEDCQRLGMGGGFYDRSLQFLLHRQYWKKPKLIGLAHELQRVDTLTTQAWDVPLQGIVTDQNIYCARKFSKPLSMQRYFV